MTEMPLLEGEQRLNDRIPLETVELYLMGEHREFLMMDISAGGIALASEYDLAVGEYLNLDCPPLAGIGLKVRSLSGLDGDSSLEDFSYRLGCQFTDPDLGDMLMRQTMDIYMNQTIF